MTRTDPLIRLDPARASRWSRGSSHPARRLARVVAIRRETPSAVTLTLHPLDEQPASYLAGQYLTLALEIDGTRYRRAYSLSAPPGGRDLQVTVKAHPDGRVSRHICKHLHTDEVLQIMGPSGSFVAPEPPPQQLVCAAAGAGITPVISIIESLLAGHPTLPVTLLYGNRSEEEILFSTRIEHLARTCPGFSVRHTLTRPGPGWQGATGRITATAVLQAGRQLDAPAHYFLCGPGDFMTTIGDALRQAGIPDSRILVERFQSATGAGTARPTDPHPVHFRTADRTVLVRPGESILEAGLRSGLDLPHSCTVGGCGNCRVRLADGDVVMDEPNCLSESERAAGDILACSAYPLGHVEVIA